MSVVSLDFKPLVKNSFIQTVVLNCIDFVKDIKSTTHYIYTEDDILTAEVSTPEGWVPENGMVLLLHGFLGSNKSTYMKRMAKKLVKGNIMACRLNMSGCGSSRNVSLKQGQYIDSQDIFEVVKYFVKLLKNTPIVLVGFSLGGNALLKMLGDMGINANKYIKGCIAVNPPVEMLESTQLLKLPKNKIYNDYMIKQIRAFVGNVDDTKKITTNYFYNTLIANHTDCKSQFEYLYNISANRVITEISVDTYILMSKDDPIVNSDAMDHIELPDNIKIFKTEYGGHVGYIGCNIFKDLYWMDNQIYKWVKSIL